MLNPSEGGNWGTTALCGLAEVPFAKLSHSLSVQRKAPCSGEVKKVAKEVFTMELYSFDDFW